MLAASLALLASACRPSSGRATGAAGMEPRRETLSQGPVQITLIAEPGRVALDRDLMLTIEVAAPEGVEVRLPPLGDRLQGFVPRASSDEDPVSGGGRTVWRRRCLLAPLPAREYRLAPMAVTYTDRRATPPLEGWLATRPVVWDSQPLPSAGAVEGELALLRLPPSWRMVLGRGALAAGAAAVLAAGVWMGRRVRRRVLERRLSPRELALRELARLLARGWIEKNRIKDFYLELTMIVRRYIERQHGIRAPEQTTEEFLAAASRDPRFPPNVLDRLKAFLEAADLVKFAAHRPSREAIDRATLTARDYLETDAASGGPRPAPESGGGSRPPAGG